MSDEKSFVPVVLDREIQSPDADAFGHRHFALLLQGLIESSRNEPPYSVGLLGRWGSGKSSIKSLYLSSLADAASSSGRTPRSQRVYPITFNAWRFGGEDIKRALLRQVYLEVGGDKEKLDDALFKHIQRSQPAPRGTWELLKEAFSQSSASLLITALVFAFVVGLAALVGWFFDLSGTTVMGAIGAVALGSATVVVKFLLDATRPTRHATITQMDAPQTAAEQYESLLIHQFEAFKRGHKKCERIVIFVDDLDRLSPEEMISGLDAVRTFMEIPKRQLPDGLGVIFVISCDEDRIADALADKRRRITNPELPGAVITHADAHRFLDRIFQFRLEIPPFPKRDMRNYGQEALLKALPDLRSELEATDVALETLIDRMIHIGVGTPRNALQIVNAFVQSWWVAKRRERDGAGTDTPGGLQEGAVTKHPLALGVTCALRVDFPDFYRDLQQEPELIKRFTEAFIHGVPLKEQPDPIQHVLLPRYAQEKDVESTPILRPEHRPLRRYLASLQGMRWPKTLRPLLFLSQDPVSRKYGDRALALHEAFVSGDEHGVLAQLGREHDSKKLSDADMRLLHEMVEELDRESEVRRNNAAAVLAALGDRYPESTAHLLLSPLARRLAESPELRWRLGVERIARSLGPVSPTDRRAVAACLLTDLLKTDGDISFQLETGEPPSLEEAMEMVRGACELVLNVSRKDGLDERHDNALLNWLESRRVAVSGREQTISFAEFDAWMADHEAWLLPAMNDRYTTLVAEQVEEDAEALDVNEVVRRCRAVFDALHEAGEDSRAVLWEQITRFVAVDESAFVILASEFVQAHVASPDGSAISAFVAAFAGRLLDESEPTEGLDLHASGQLLVEVVTKRRLDLEASCDEALADLITQWSQDETTAQLAADLLTPICGHFTESEHRIVQGWIGRLLSDLPGPCVDWISENFATAVSEQLRRQLVKQIAPIHQTDNITPQQASQYRRFTQGLSESALSTQEFLGHLNSVIDQVRQRHNNPNDYLRRVFPAIPHTLASAAPEQVGPMLSELFANTKADPALFGWLHGHMADHWPNPSDVPQYDPEQVFSDAFEVAQRQPAQESMGGALRTMTELARKEFVREGRAVDAVGAACQLWQHHPDEATETFRVIDASAEPEHVAGMADDLEAGDGKSVTRLVEAWRLLAGRMDLNDRVATGIHLLANPARGTEGEPDLCLRSWITSKDGDTEPLLESLLTADELNDEQRRRVWLQIEQTEGLGLDFFARVLPKVAGMEDSPQTLSEVISFEAKVGGQASSEDERYALGQRVVEAFRVSSSQEAKNRLAELLKSLNVDGVLSELPNYGELSDDEVAVLDSHFARSKYWKKVKGT